MRVWSAVMGAALWGFGAISAAGQTAVSIVYLRQEVERPPVLSNLDAIPEDEGIAGAEVGLDDNQTTGKFLGQTYELSVINVAPEGDFVAAAEQALSQSQFIVIDAPATQVLQVADLPQATSAILLNIAAPEVSLRDADCRRNVLHTLPSDDMRADALMQFLQSRRWDELVMITGPHPADLSFAQALRTSASKFGLKLKAEKEWLFDANMRRAASAEVPLFTQEFPRHDVMLIADEVGDFARYIPYNTWEPDVIAGSEGARPVAWSPVMEQWGGVQLQNRFEEHAQRNMRPIDYAAFIAVRALGEAVTRTSSSDPETLRSYLLSDSFELAGFKGQPLSFRSWNGQLRQPIPVVHANAVIATPPLEGFLHPRSDLDTLGLDEPETQCTAFTE